MKQQTIHLGFEVGSGEPVSIPLAHTFVTGQTQLSGKTTTLRAIVERSGQRALAFVTKRGERFDGRRIRPYLPREGEQPIHWRLVETILASALGQKSMKYERLWLINAVKRPAVATSLSMVRGNVAALIAKAKGTSADVYTLIGEYLDLVLPDMRALNASDTLDLQPGLNVMDLTDVGPQLQALVIRASLEHINRHERGVLTVFPEAWEFAPRNMNSPAKEAAIATARKGAVLGNFLLCDSQDIAGVDTVIRQAASVWILGVQRELNELKRTIQTIPAGIKRPKPEDVATLQIGQFFACWGTHAVKTQVQPAWMDEATCRAIAAGERSLDDVKLPPPAAPAAPPPQRKESAVPSDHGLDSGLAAQLARLSRVMEEMPQKVAAMVAKPAAAAAPAPAPSNGHGAAVVARSSSTVESFEGDEETRYQAFKTRLMQEAATDPQLVRIFATRPELEVAVQRVVVKVDGTSIKGRVGRLIAQGWFKEPRSSRSVRSELARTGPDTNNKTLAVALKEYVKLGFLTDESDGLTEVAGMKASLVDAEEAA